MNEEESPQTVPRRDNRNDSKKSEVLNMAIKLLRLILEGPVSGGETELSETKRNAAGALIGFARQSRAETIATHRGMDPAGVVALGRAAAKESIDFANDPNTTSAQVRSELAQISRMLERELEG